MQRATSVYVIMLIAFGIGLWGIITTGSVFLRAPHDLSGKWELRERQASPDDDPVHEMLVDQSGRFFRVSIDQQAHSLTLAAETHQKQEPRVQIRLDSSTLKLKFERSADPNQYLVRASGPIQGHWLGTRIRPTARRGAPPPATQHARP
jgi:hypothetical protein